MSENATGIPITRNYVIFRPNGEVVQVNAVQYDGTNDDQVREAHPRCLWPAQLVAVGIPFMRPGQWLAVSATGEVWVLDDEPVYAVDYEYGVHHVGAETDPHLLAHQSEHHARTDYETCGMFCALVRRAVFSRDGFTGPWVEVSE